MAMKVSESISLPLTLDRLPEDTISLILQKLPFKTLVGFTLLSKYFNSFIRNPSFIYSYDANAASDDESFISLRWHVQNCSKITCSFDSGTTGRTKDYVLDPSSLGPLSIEAVGSCNGLICLKECPGESIILWNPRIMRSFILPKTSHSYISRLGLGFASKDNDYKVLNVNYGQNRRDLVLYSLKLNSWRSIGSAPDSYIIGRCFPCPPMVFAGGSLHYVEANFRQGGGISNSIVAFDLGNEVLRTIALPETLLTRGNAGHQQLSISEYNGSASIDTHVCTTYG